MKETANRIDYQAKFIRDKVSEIKRYSYTTIEITKHQPAFENELQEQGIHYRISGTNIKMYIKEE